MTSARPAALLVAALFALAACASEPAKSGSAMEHDGSETMCGQAAAAAAAAQPAPAAAKLEMRSIAASADYPLGTCLVTGEELSASHRVAYSYGGTEVQFCCPHCAETFVAHPAEYLAKLKAAAAK
jgi:YHS domain-containing protein